VEEELARRPWVAVGRSGWIFIGTGPLSGAICGFSPQQIEWALQYDIPIVIH
jgi:hypothetical protein